MEPLKFGVIGCGMAGEFHYLGMKNVQNPNFKFTAAFDADEKKLNKFAKFKKMTPYPTLEKLLESDVDAVCIFLPHHLHAKVMKECAKAKKHILCEKPMADSIEECDEMIQIAKQSGIKFMIAENHRFLPVHVLMNNLIRKDYLGDIFLGRTYEGAYCEFAEFMDPKIWHFRWDTGGGGVVMDQGVHKFTFLNWIMNSEVESATCWLSKALPSPPEKAEDNAIIKLKYKNGAIIDVSLSSLAIHPLTNITEFHGTKGSMFEDHSWEKPLKIFSSHPDAEKKGEYFYPSVEHGAYPLYYNIAAREEDSYFAQCIIDNKMPEFTPEMARNGIEVVFLAYFAAKNGRTTTMAEFREYLKTHSSKSIMEGMINHVQKNYERIKWENLKKY